MNIVINIDEEVYKRTLPYKDLPIISNLANDYSELTHGVANGTPLPKGHWKPIYQGDEIIDYRCSECEFGSTFGKSTIGMNFCPNCGAEMNEVQE